MARIRTIKPDFFRHEGLYDAEKETGLPIRVAFAGLWTASDRAGRFEWKPKTLKLDCLPHDEVDFARVLDVLLTRGFVRRYTSNGRCYGYVPSWNDHQAINNREAESILPDPKESEEESIPLTREARVDDASATPLMHAPAEGKGREGERKGKEKKPRAVRAPKPDLTLTDWTDTLPDGSFAIPPEDPIFDWAAKAGIPPDWIDLAWRAFADRYGPNGAGKAKRYADWRAVFRTAVKDDWLHVWRHTPQGFVLTTVGETWKRAA